MKVLYLIGPYRAETTYEVVINIRRAEVWSVAVWRMGGACVCPHKNTALLDGACSDEVWLRGSVEIMKRCDGVVLIPNWRESKGSCVEVATATDCGIPIFDMGVGTDQDRLREFCK